MAQLIERLASRLFHRFHRLQGTLRVAGSNGLGGACLHCHQAHPVGDNIMQLASDPGSLLGHRLTSCGRLFPFALRSTLIEESQVVFTNPDASADGPHRGEEQ